MNKGISLNFSHFDYFVLESLLLFSLKPKTYKLCSWLFKPKHSSVQVSNYFHLIFKWQYHNQ